MSRPKYEQPTAYVLDRTLAVSLGGCTSGFTPGTCGLPGNYAGTCDPTGASEGNPGGQICTTTGNFAQTGCTNGNSANAPEVEPPTGSSAF